MKTKLRKLTRVELEQMYYHFFNTCSNCRDFIQFVPKTHLINKILEEVSKREIEDYFNSFVFSKF